MKTKLVITRKVLFEKFSIKNEMEVFFLSFLDGCEIKFTERYPDSVFYLKNDKVLFQQDFKNKSFYVRFDSIWSVFNSKYNLTDQQIQVFMKGVLEEHVKLEGYTQLKRTMQRQQKLEEHVKLEGYTPHSLVHHLFLMLEEHLKLEGYTPTTMYLKHSLK